MDVFSIIRILGEFLDLIGVVILVLGIVLATVMFISRWVIHATLHDEYKVYRQNLGRVILLGLEILVAGDIIRSVAGTPTFSSVGVLAILVLIRTFLGITFEMEVDGRWPWNRK